MKQKVKWKQSVCLEGGAKTNTHKTLVNLNKTLLSLDCVCLGLMSFVFSLNHNLIGHFSWSTGWAAVSYKVDPIEMRFLLI